MRRDRGAGSEDRAPVPPPAEVDDLRRRLYRPGAGEEDVRRYVAARPDPTEDPEPADEVAAPRRPWSRRGTAAALVAVGAGLLAVAAALVAPPGGAAPAPSASAPPRPLLVDVGEGRAIDVARGSESPPAVVFTELQGTPVLGRRVEGRGTAVVALGASEDATGGRAVVAVATDVGARVTWRALLDVERPDWTSSVTVLARGRAASPGDDVRPTAFTWEDRSPTRIAVVAPVGVRWALVYAATVGPEPTLR
ncbi:hypothetical protein [Amnibacterium endophyticum]|uniref:DUF1707 domain-containing protein n=1 Tax=Amnibacterium endophyticum TaxID=2109337 RepID=A0ABW4LG00_9MICO